ncbi:MAG TPA: carbonic anhydrase [Porticoccaceae bacterium]|nr:carbonic anhydrase [Porticoccaceae bacterium]
MTKNNPPPSPHEALERLREGNQRFVARLHSETASGLERRLTEIPPADRQSPVAIIVGCSDSRVPAEFVFDQGLGDLFVIRVAGNVVAPSQVGSVEFAAEQFGTQLVVVLGHSRCGAVQATLDELERPTENRSRNLSSIVDRIRPSVETLLETDLRDNPEELIKHAVRANIRTATYHLRYGSPILEQLIKQGRLAVVGAEYCLENGTVDFFDGVAETP